jgi:hypothetical protein
MNGVPVSAKFLNVSLAFATTTPQAVSSGIPFGKEEVGPSLMRG